MVDIPEFINETDEYKAFLFSRRYYTKAQVSKCMNYVIQEGGVCPECDGSRMSNPDDFDQNYEPCERCGGSGKFDITVRDAINKAGGE